MTTAITTRTNKGSSLTFSEMDTNFDTLAIQSMWIPAGAMYPSSTNPCAGLAQVETTALRPDLKVLDFDASSDEFAQFAVVWPNSWDKGTLTFKAFFTVTGTNTGTVAWGLAGVAISDDDSINTAFPTATVATAKAHSGTSNDLNVTNESDVVAVSGSPVNDDMVFFQVQRYVSADNSADDQSGDARLLGIKITFII
jgi:hypothetical protein